MATESIFYIAGIPLAFIGADGMFRFEKLTPEDRATVESKLTPLLAGPIVFDHRDDEERLLDRIQEEYRQALDTPRPVSGDVLIGPVAL